MLREDKLTATGATAALWEEVVGGRDLSSSSSSGRSSLDVGERQEEARYESGADGSPSHPLFACHFILIILYSGLLLRDAAPLPSLPPPYSLHRFISYSCIS